MPVSKALQVVKLASTVRFVQGYRYLDRCGEALIRLEDALDEGWIPGEVRPQGGQMRNYRLGMAARFDSESLSVRQSEYLSFEHFCDQTCKTYDILWKTFDIEKALTPSLQVMLQVGFDELAAATAHALKYDLWTPKQSILQRMGGDKSALSITLCTEADVMRGGAPGVQRNRLDFQVIRQETQPDFDERVMRRLPLLPVGHQEALGPLMRLRRQHPRVAPAAVQFDLESSCEGEFLTRSFDLAAFLTDSWEWAASIHAFLDSGEAQTST